MELMTDELRKIIPPLYSTEEIEDPIVALSITIIWKGFDIKRILVYFGLTTMFFLSIVKMVKFLYS